MNEDFAHGDAMSSPVRRMARASARPPLAIAILALSGLLAAPALEAQSCLGFDGGGFLAATTTARGDDRWFGNGRGLGGAAGISLGPVGATASFSRVDVVDSEHHIRDLRGQFAVELPFPAVSICPVGTVGYETTTAEGLLESDPDDFVFGAGVAAGLRFSSSTTGIVLIPSAMVGLGHRRIMEGADDASFVRDFGGVFQVGATLRIGRLFGRVYGVVTTNGSDEITGAAVGLAF